MNHLSRYQQERPVGWSRVIQIVEADSDAGGRLILCSLDDDHVFVSAWEEIQSVVDPHGAGPAHAVKQSIDTRKAGQHNALVFDGPGFFHYRFSHQRRQVAQSDAPQTTSPAAPARPVGAGAPGAPGAPAS